MCRHIFLCQLWQTRKHVGGAAARTRAVVRADSTEGEWLPTSTTWGGQHATGTRYRCDPGQPASAAVSLRNLSLENQFKIPRCPINPGAGSKDLNEAPPIPRVLLNLLPILQLSHALRTQPTLAEPNKLILILGFHRVCDFSLRYGLAGKHSGSAKAGLPRSPIRGGKSTFLSVRVQVLNAAVYLTRILARPTRKTITKSGLLCSLGIRGMNQMHESARSVARISRRLWVPDSDCQAIGGRFLARTARWEVSSGQS